MWANLTEKQMFVLVYLLDPQWLYKKEKRTLH